MNPITLVHARKAVKYLSSGNIQHDGIEGFDQATFCDTVCCFFGHANAIAGNEPFETSEEARKALSSFVRRGGSEVHRAFARLARGKRTPLSEFRALLGGSR